MPPLARIVPSRPHYGWWIIAATLAVTFVGVGVGYYTLAVFLQPLRDAHGWSNTAVAGATGLYFSISGITSALIGPAIDRNGPLRFMVMGALGMGAAIAAVGSLSQLWQLYLVYTLLAVSAGFLLGTGASAIINRWFVTRRAQAMSIAFSGPSIGGMVFVPLGTFLIDRGGLGLASPVLGLVAVAVALPAVLLVLVWDPIQMDSSPDFGRPLDVKNELLADDVQRRVWGRAEAVRTVPFWALLVGFTLVLGAQTGFLIHQIAFLTDRLGSAQAASFAVTFTAFGSAAARLVVGAFGDRVDRRLFTIALFVVQAVSVVALVLIDNVAVSWGLVLIIGFTLGNIYMMQTLLVSDVFGQLSFATVMGMIGLWVGIGTGVGPVAVGWIEDLTGSYTAAFIATSVTTLVAAVIVSFAKPPDSDKSGPLADALA